MYINILTNVSRETFSSKSRIIANLTSRFTRPAPAPPPQKSELGRRTPSTPPQTTAPPAAPEGSESSPPKPAAGSARPPYPHPTATPPYSTPEAAPPPDTAPPPLHPSRRSRLGCADEGTASRPAHRSRRKCRAVPQPRHRPPKSARLSPDRKRRSCTHAIAAGQWPPPNFPQESGNPETVSVASPGFRGQPFRPRPRACQRIRLLQDRRSPRS